VFGGLDRARLAPTGISINFGADDYVAPRVAVMSAIAQNTLQGVISFTDNGPFMAAIDSTVPELWLPRPMCDEFERAFGLTYQNKSNRYLVNDTMHEEVKDLNPFITFHIANNTRNGGNTTQVLLPYAAFDLQLGWPISNTSTNYFPLRRATNESQYKLGRVFLQEAYLIVDFERRNFTISPAQFPDMNTPPDVIPITSPSEPPDHRLGTRVIAGISVAVFFALLAAVLAAMFALRRRRRASQKALEPSDPSQDEKVGTELDSEQRLGKDTETEMAGGEIVELPGAGPQELDSVVAIAEMAAESPRELDSKRVDVWRERAS
jgi:hypothetical protein